MDLPLINAYHMICRFLDFEVIVRFHVQTKLRIADYAFLTEFESISRVIILRARLLFLVPLAVTLSHGMKSVILNVWIYLLLHTSLP